MEYIALTEKERATKEIVVKKLYKLKDYIENMVFSNIEDDLSFSSSLIVVSHTSKDDNRILRAVQKRVDTEQMYKNYAKYLSCLNKYDSRLRDMIEYRYFMKYEISWISWKTLIDRKNISYLINKACLILAYFDSEINYTINDFSDYIARSHSESFKIQDTVRVLLVEYNNATQDTLSTISKIFNFLTGDLETIYKQKTEYNRKNYLRIIYSIAYIHPELTFDREHFEKAAARTALSKSIQNRLFTANEFMDDIKKTSKRSFDVYLKRRD